MKEINKKIKNNQCWQGIEFDWTEIISIEVYGDLMRLDHDVFLWDSPSHLIRKWNERWINYNEDQLEDMDQLSNETINNSKEGNGMTVTKEEAVSEDERRSIVTTMGETTFMVSHRNGYRMVSCLGEQRECKRGE